MGYTLPDNRHGPGRQRHGHAGADGFAEREAAKAMIRDACQAIASPDTEVTLGADKGYDAAEFIRGGHQHQSSRPVS